jgi:glycogen debranching enzyme
MVVEHLFNPREFWTPYPVAALARSERWYSRDHLPSDLGCSWRANVWIPTNYMIYRGLRRYGYRDLASIVAHYTHALVRAAGNREYYDAETGEGCGLDPFWGWSLLAHFLPYEEGTDFDVTAVT